MRKLLIILLLTLTSLLIIPKYDYQASSIVGPDVIYKQANQIFTTSTIKKLYSAPEELEILSDGYTGKGDQVGIYYLTLGAGDLTKEVRIEVKQLIEAKVLAVIVSDGVPTILINKDKELIINSLTKDPIDILKRIGMITVTSSTLPVILVNDYTENKNSPGDYLFEFRLDAADGSEQHIISKIRVINNDTLDDAQFEPSGSNTAWIWWVILIIFGIIIGQAILKRRK